MRVTIDPNDSFGVPQRANMNPVYASLYGQTHHKGRQDPPGITLSLRDAENGELMIYFTMEQAEKLLKIVPEPGQKIIVDGQEKINH
jgi:hypothetical protein